MARPLFLLDPTIIRRMKRSTRAQRYAAEASQAFDGEVIVPADWQHVKI